MTFSGHVYPDDAVAYFRIATPTQRQPIEPVSVGEFRIGSGADCHLRLGGDDIPEVHTVLNVDRERVILKCKCQHSPVCVNGQPTQECLLMDGDLVEFGSYRLLFRLLAPESRITLNETEFGTVDAANLSANQLVKELERQLDIVQELSESADVGVSQLINAAMVTGGAQDAASTASEEITSSQSAEFQTVISMLQQQHEASRIRLESLTEVLNNVVRQQKLIADTLEVMSGRIQALDASSPAAPSRRASA